MYCIKCGVKLSPSEKKCPLCNTAVCHPDFTEFAEPLYPSGRKPKGSINSKFVCGAGIILFLIPLAVCFFADFNIDMRLDWFGYVAGALALAYVMFALPLWFKKPNPVIFTPCSFAAAALYLMYISLATRGVWFWSFALPVLSLLAVTVCTVVALWRYVRKGKLFIIGGAFVALGGVMPITELLLTETFGIGFWGWSFYPLVVLLLIGGLLIYLGISKTARDILERKFFF